MSMSPSSLLRCSSRISRSSFTSSSCTRCTALASSRRRKNDLSSRRLQSTTTDASEGATNAKIVSIVDEISKLTLLETADLVASLKSRLNIPDMPIGGFAMGGGGGVGGGGPSPVAAVEEDEPEPAAQEKTLFNLKLQSFEGGSKPKVIKEIKSMLGLSLVDSKKFVESAPKMMKEGVPKEEAEKLVETMKALGAVVAME